MLLQILDVDYVFANKPIIRIFAKKEDGKCVCVFYDRFFPYFYAKPKDSKTIEELQKINEIKEIEPVERFLPLGFHRKPDELLRLTLLNPSDVPAVRERIMKFVEDIYEADILFKYRFMVDYELYGMQWIDVDAVPERTTTVKVPALHAKSIMPVERIGNAPLRYMAFDIECLAPDPTVPLDSKKDPIIIVSLAFKPEFNGNETLVLTAKPFRGEGVQSFSNEKEMLAEFLKIIETYDPDIITGYNINAFDFPYLVERLKQNKLPLNLGRCDKPIFSKKFGIVEEFYITGRIIADPYQILRMDPWIKMLRYDLNTVAKSMLNEQKHSVEYGEMKTLWNGNREDMKRLVEYARKDAELSLKLLLERHLLDKFFELSKISGALLQDIFGGQTRRVETMLLHEFGKREFVMPCAPAGAELNKRNNEREKMGLKGATVLEPEKGLHTEGCILVLDFKSLYPSLMRTYNISPDTLILDRSEKNINELKGIKSPNGSYFVDQSIAEGIIPYQVKKLIEKRAETKKLMKKKQGEERRSLNITQLALKDMANSVHSETDIVVKDQEHGIRVLEIAGLFDELASNGHKIKKVGNSDVIELSGLQTLSVQNDKACFKPLYAISRHVHDGNLIKLRTRMGEVSITKDHSIIEMKGKAGNRIRESDFRGLAPIKGSDVNKNTIIAQVNKIDIDKYTKQQTELNLIELLSNTKEADDLFVYIPKNLNLNKHKWFENRVKIFNYLRGKTINGKQIIDDLNIDRRVLRKTENNGIMRLGLTTVGNCGLVPLYTITDDADDYISFYDTFKEAGENPNFYKIPLTALKSVRIPKKILKKCSIAVDRNRARRKIPALITITEELAELFGWYVSEGSCYKNKRNGHTSYNASIVNYNNKIKERIKYLAKKVFGYDANIIKNQVYLNPKVFYLLFRLSCGKGASEKRIPDFIMNSQKEIREAFLRGYTMGDGDSNGRRLSTKSKRLAAQLSFLLKKENCILHNGTDSGMFRISKRTFSQGKKMVSGDLFGQAPVEIKETEPADYVYDLSVEETENFVTAQGLVLHNSFYGYTGYVRARLYMIDVANTITAFGRENLMKTKKLIEENFGIRVIYADTDSAFLKTNIKDLDEAKDLGEKIAKFVSEQLPGFLELEFEKVYRTFLILTKKRYAGWKFELSENEWKDNIEMRGIETIRRDWCSLVSEIMNDVINIVLKEGDIQKAIDKVKDVLIKLRKGEIPLEKLTIVKGITKNIDRYDGILPHIELAKKIARRNPREAPKIGDRIGFVIIRGNQMLSKRAEDPEYAKKHELQIDSDYYINNQVFPPLERIFTAVGVEKGEVFGSGRQASLGDIMNGTKAKRKHEIEIEHKKALDDWEEFACTKCSKTYRRMPLQGVCECGGEILISCRGSLGKKIVMK